MLLNVSLSQREKKVLLSDIDFTVFVCVGKHFISFFWVFFCTFHSFILIIFSVIIHVILIRKHMKFHRRENPYAENGLKEKR